MLARTAETAATDPAAAELPEAAVAAAAVAAYDVAPDSVPTLLNHSENVTFGLVDAASGQRSVLRVHRAGYHRRTEIAAELDWLAALRRSGEIAVPVVVPARDGRRIVTVEHDGTPRHVVRFDWVPGVSRDDARRTAADFHVLGRLTAVLHEHARSWPRPAGFDRFTWDWGNTLGATPRWGRWQDAVGVDTAAAGVLGRAIALLGERLARHGTGPDVFGLIHADLRSTNLLIRGGAPHGDQDGVTVIDFDDCGFGWYLYDFGAAVSFVEDHPALPNWQEAWVRGYRSRQPLSVADEAMLPSFVLLRRLLLLAWMGTRAHSAESVRLAGTFAVGSVGLAERYLRHGGTRL